MEQLSNRYSRYIPYAVAGVAASAGIYFLYRQFFAGPSISQQVEENLPLAKDLPTITDFEGNYDIDGVSFDVEGVIISSDDNKDAEPTLDF